MRQRSTALLVGTMLSLLLGMLVTPVSAETSVQQSSSTSVDQNAQVSGGEMRIEQDAHTRTETGDTVVERGAELEATKEAGEPAQIERDTDRHIVNPGNASVSGDIDQSVAEGEDSLTTGQQVTQSVTDAADATGEQSTESAAYADADTAADTETDSAATSTDPQMQMVKQDMSGVVDAVIDTLGSAVAALLP